MLIYLFKSYQLSHFFSLPPSKSALCILLSGALVGIIGVEWSQTLEWIQLGLTQT